MSVITVAQAREGLVKAIAEKGEDYLYEKYVDENGYSMCKYVVQDAKGDDCPSCIVGYAINCIDPALFAILAVEEAENGGMSALEIHAVDFESSAKWALQAAQTVQDGCGTWGEALEAFDKYLAGEIPAYH